MNSVLLKICLLFSFIHYLSASYKRKSSERLFVEASDGKNYNITKEVLKNPCIVRSCVKGRMCRVIDNNKQKSVEQRTQCYCPKVCPNERRPVCSIYGETFPNKCLLHIKACKLGANVPIAYEGECIVEKKSVCTQQELAEFSARFLDWMHMVRHEIVYGYTDFNNDINKLPHTEQVHVAKWMYEYFDGNANNILDGEEVKSIIMYLASVENCVSTFLLESCDQNFDGNISFSEWKICLITGSNSVEEDFFFEI